MAEWKNGKLVASYSGGSTALKENIESILNLTKSKKKLPEAPKREKIEASKFEVVPEGGSTAGIASPLTEQEYDGTVFYQLTSSDGLFVLEFGTYTDYVDGSGNPVRVVHLEQPIPPPP